MTDQTHGGSLTTMRVRRVYANLTQLCERLIGLTLLGQLALE
jgi:hypothetical protein